MALFAGKSDEEKGLERIAKALDGMMLKESDGKVHAGLFEIGGLSDIKATTACCPSCRSAATRSST